MLRFHITSNNLKKERHNVSGWQIESEFMEPEKLQRASAFCWNVQRHESHTYFSVFTIIPSATSFGTSLPNVVSVKMNTHITIIQSESYLQKTPLDSLRTAFMTTNVTSCLMSNSPLSHFCLRRSTLLTIHLSKTGV